MTQACYAMGYNLAIEYLADYEKTWMLDSFRALNARVLIPQQRSLSEWLFLEVVFGLPLVSQGLDALSMHFHQHLPSWELRTYGICGKECMTAIPQMCTKQSGIEKYQNMRGLIGMGTGACRGRG
jgi:hypothetical protein